MNGRVCMNAEKVIMWVKGTRNKKRDEKGENKSFFF